MHIYETGRSGLGDQGMRLYRELRQRLEFEYGADKVTESLPLLSP
jgi:hypothetical protein